MEDKLQFFNKEGDSLNFSFNDFSQKYEGNLIFDENSSDTFKTIGLYMFETLESISYDLLDSNEDDALFLNKFQLFNEYGIDFIGNRYDNKQVTFIEAVNDDSTFYSKWIYGDNFESFFPLGSELIFSTNIADFASTNRTYTVIGTKKGAVMVLSDTDNKTFNTNYSGLLSIQSNYTNINVTGIDAIKVHEYIDSSYNYNLSDWSEPEFFVKLFNNQKLSIVNTKDGLNDKVVTVENKDIVDNNYFRYESNATVSNNIIIEYISKGDVPKVYNGNITIDNTNSQIVLTAPIPVFLRPGVEFTIPSSVTNNITLEVGNIDLFNNTSLTEYTNGDIVLYENKVYICVTTYTQLPGSEINPLDTNYWILSDTIPIENSLANEFLTNSSIYLTDNKLYFEYPFDISDIVTKGSAVEKYKETLKLLKVDLYMKESQICAELLYPTKYAIVNIYESNLTNNITNTVTNFEKIIHVKEDLVTEKNSDISKLTEYKCVFTSFDSFGLKIFINGLEYYEPTAFSFIGNSVDMPRTIDRTLRNWINKFSFTLLKLGIEPELYYTGNISSIYNNSIRFRTTYPNVPLDFNIIVGSIGNFYIENRHITFFDMGGSLTVLINGVSYRETFDTDISTTLENWVNSHKLVLNSLDIIVSSNNQNLHIDTKEIDANISTFEIRIGKDFKPFESPFEIRERFSNNQGIVISSNEVIHSETGVSFLDEPFSTGMLTSVNNSFYPLNNQEYNLLYIDDNTLTLSYQGPFWGNTQSVPVNAFQAFAFDSGFGYDSNGNNITQPIQPTYSVNTFGSPTSSVDLIYTQIAEYIYVLGSDLYVYDAQNSQLITQFGLSITNPINLELNPINNYLYILSQNEMVVVDPTLNTIIYTTTLINNSFDLKINNSNGEVYITQSAQIAVYSPSNALIQSITINSTNGQLVYHRVEEMMYCTLPSLGQTIRIDTDTYTISDTYTTPSISGDLYYNMFNYQVYGFYNNELFSIENNSLTSLGVNKTSEHYFTFNYIDNTLYVSTDLNEISIVDEANSIDTYNIGLYGHILYNSIDNNVYISNGNDVSIFEPVNNTILDTITIGSVTDKLILNELNNNIWGLLPTIDEVFEIQLSALYLSTLPQTTNLSNGDLNITDGQFGTLDPNYQAMDNLLLITREFIRRPRENYMVENDVQVKYKWHWRDDISEDIFIYDFSGKQLDTSGAYVYTGPKPLPSEKIFLNKYPNRHVSKNSDPTVQQTIFETIDYTLDYIDSSTNISFVPEPLELFLGFNSKLEGTSKRELVLTKIEDISFDIVTNGTNTNIITFKNIDSNTGEILLDVNSTDNFLNKKLKKNQILKINVIDNTNVENQHISYNNGKTFRITDIYSRIIRLEYLEDKLVDETTEINNYPTDGDVTYMTTTFTVDDKEIASFNVMGQTEIEDERFKINLNNIGKNLTPDDTFIFKEYDISEQGVDWKFLNKKRKEMLMVKPEIYNFIGSYKSIINAINLFGYNDLELYEYYRNVNRSSKNFGKLHKVEIPDIFDNTVPGWEASDFIKNTMPNENYDETNLFNLTYRITDKEGNSVLGYSLDEVIIKLAGLKNWLEKNIIPLTHDILDITGRTDTVGDIAIQHENYSVTGININNNMTPINFKINEAYLHPINNGSSVYNVVMDIFASDEELPDYYKIDIRTYQIYKEWESFTTYSDGDLVEYLGKVYKSAINDNQLNRPNKYINENEWQPDVEYSFAQIVIYNRRVYSYVGGSTDDTNPFNNPNWTDITRWEEVDIMPVQKIVEYRYEDDLSDFNFTVDSNIDPYVVIELNSDNGYGQTYTVKKSFEIIYDRNSIANIKYIRTGGSGTVDDTLNTYVESGYVSDYLL